MIGFYTKISFSVVSYTIKQIIALALFGIGIVLLVNKINMDSLYKLTIVMIAGLWLPNIVRALVKAGDSSESKAAKKIEDKIDKYL